MDKIIGTWSCVELFQTISYFQDGTFSCQYHNIGVISGRYDFRNGIYFIKITSVGVAAFKILSYSNTSMRVGMNTGEVYTCHRLSATPIMLQAHPLSQSYQNLNQTMAHFDQQNAQAFAQLSQHNAAMSNQLNQQNAALYQQISQLQNHSNQQLGAIYPSMMMMNNNTGSGIEPYTSLVGGNNNFGGDGASPFQASNNVVGNNNSTSGQSSSLMQSATEQCVTSAAGAFGEAVGGAAGEFTAGVGFEIGGMILGGLFGGI